MGIEHRMKDEQDDVFWKCPECGCVEELAKSMPNTKPIECAECGEESVPKDNLATWEDFWEYCRSLKDI